MKKLLNFVRIYVVGLQRYLNFFIIVNVQFVVFVVKELVLNINCNYIDDYI